ncbi:hypothetical protein BCCR75502_00924 [Burkholderia sola]|nr:hypothetical protein BCCR75389_00912 [Burkholderia cenocepacia]CAG2263978.1 hypothetical protein BCCR75386_00925 [Burkholderia cenocepacia]CAG2264099.1 hypothetical protein BCCR75388_00926 [Burkholderia cenocepacia]CAG2264173.1 hypothetical protein BCCR75384_00926 [Burkholderia cenocepacia]CAG2264179.1 hypothetical protein BCCR75387_00926 [Burkholderia cenocepacia]
MVAVKSHAAGYARWLAAPSAAGGHEASGVPNGTGRADRARWSA